MFALDAARPLRRAVRLLAVCLMLPLLAAGASRAGDDAEEDTVDSENLFGFTEGSDIGKKGQQEVVLDTIGAFSKRRGGPGLSGYAAAQPILSYQYDATDNFSIEPGLIFDTRDTRNVAGIPDKTFGVFNGLSLELKYQFLKRTNALPIGVALQVEPQWTRITPVEGQGADIFSVETRLMADIRLVPDKLWLGANMIFDPSVAHIKGSGAVDRNSTLSWSGALMGQVFKNAFVGPELRYARAYDGSFLNRFTGHAVFLGPVAHYQVSEKGFLTLAYATQLSGHDRDPEFARRAFELNQFSRHNLRVRFGLDF